MPQAGREQAITDEPRYDAFISYSREDDAFAEQLRAALEAHTPPRSLVPSRQRLSK
jgi:hypothetical protein